MTPDKNQDQPEALRALRDHLGLYDCVPVIEEAHVTNPMALDPIDRTVLLCVHDGANERAHQIWFPAPQGPFTLMDESGEIRKEVLAHCTLYLSAAYN